MTQILLLTTNCYSYAPPLKAYKKYEFPDWLITEIRLVSSCRYLPYCDFYDQGDKVVL